MMSHFDVPLTDVVEGIPYGAGVFCLVPSYNPTNIVIRIYSTFLILLLCNGFSDG